jgi:type IV pilus assembly protein PilO
MNMAELRSLDPANIGSWPAPIKALVILLLCAAVLGAGYYFDTQNQLTELAKQEKSEQDLRKQFEGKQRQAASLEPLKRQLREMNESFGALLRLLPNRTEVEALLVDISQAGLASGLEFELFKPGGEKKQEFIATLPIQIRVNGTYHEFGEFISKVAALPRIVTQHNITIAPRSVGVKKDDKKIGTTGNKSIPLSMTMTAQTYRYLEESEIQAAKNTGKGKKKKRKKRK